MAVTSYGRNKNHDDEIKKHSRTSPDVQFKEFSLTKQKKLDQEWTMSEFRKPFKKRSKSKKKTENQCQNAACEQKKPLARNENSIQTKN